MKNITAFVLASSLVATAATAGGPAVVAVEAEPEAVVAGPTSSMNSGIVVPLLLLIVLGLALSSNPAP